MRHEVKNPMRGTIQAFEEPFEEPFGIFFPAPRTLDSLTVFPEVKLC